MTAKEKAKELTEKFEKVGCRASPEAERHSAKQCALILCNEVLGLRVAWFSEAIEYWQSVKEEIQKL